MALSDSLPSDSVLRRHALTERNRILGLPPTDAVLRRHFDQWRAAQQAHAAAQPRPAAVMAAAPRAAMPAARAAAAPAVSPAASTIVPSPRPRIPPAPVPMPAPRDAAPSGGGGLFGWLRRIFGR
ncbi:MAG TPA: hypothetical protein PLW24_01700 [Burkholderiaceae bacterium]|nr:hypothetical protein [Burkholderiaceae bacterium]